MIFTNEVSKNVEEVLVPQNLHGKLLTLAFLRYYKNTLLDNSRILDIDSAKENDI